MSDKMPVVQEGSLQAPQRHDINWQNEIYYNESSLLAELQRVFDICHGCRRCFNLCHAFPTLFDAIDESTTMEIDGVSKSVYWEVVDHCYLCDMCFMTKCPYVPPHEWNIDFPHLMLRAKAVKFKKGEVRKSAKFLSNTDKMGKLASKPMVAKIINWANANGLARKLTGKFLGVHENARLPSYHRKNLSRRLRSRAVSKLQPQAGKYKVLLFASCYGNYNEPELGEDLAVVFEHNGIQLAIAENMLCCGMPKLELGDLESVEIFKNNNISELVDWVNQGWEIIAPVPSCVLMFKQELPLMFPNDTDVQRVREHFFDPFEYLMAMHKNGKFNTDFKTPLGKIAYHVACHQRVQNIGLKTKEILQLIPDTDVEAIERCSGHDGTYGVKKQFFEMAMKIAKPVVSRVEKSQCAYFTSDCPMAAHHIEHAMAKEISLMHPMRLLRKAYGI